MNIEKIAVLEPEIVGEQLAKVEKDAGLTEDNAVALRGQFADYYNEIVEWRGKASLITDPADTTCQKIARDVRLNLKSIRCNVENTRKALKADSLARGKAIDGFANVLKYLCEPIEAQLLEVETYVERQEAARITALVEERTRKLVAIGGDPAAYNLGAIDESTFVIILDTIKKQIIEREEAARKAEAERIAKEQAELAERERIRAENERLKKEAAERDRAAVKLKSEQEAEKAALKAKLDAAQKEKEAIERKQAEAARKEEEEKHAELMAKKKAARAPDKEKIRMFVGGIFCAPMPDLKTSEGISAGVAICKILNEAQKRIQAIVEQL